MSGFGFVGDTKSELMFVLSVATICLQVLLGRLNFRGGMSPGKSQTDD